MIEFNGQISGAAKKRFIQRNKILAQNFVLGSMLILCPIILYISISTQFWSLLILFCSMFVIIPILIWLPITNKNILESLPTKVYTEEEYIVCECKNLEEFKPLCDVELVRDFGEFYELVFPFGKISSHFICQKDLLVRGTLKEFEALFEGKIEKKK